jgi:outer membrane phospholipase A
MYQVFTHEIVHMYPQLWCSRMGDRLEVQYARQSGWQIWNPKSHSPMRDPTRACGNYGVS